MDHQTGLVLAVVGAIALAGIVVAAVTAYVNGQIALF